MNFGEALIRHRITRIIHGYLDQDSPCLGAVRDSFIEPGGAPTRRRRVGDLGRYAFPAAVPRLAPWAMVRSPLRGSA